VKDEEKTKEQLIIELDSLRKKIGKIKNRDNVQKKITKNIKYQNTFLKRVIDSLPYPFYIINIKNYAVEMVNSIAGVSNLNEHSFCYNISHKKTEPCTRYGETCPLKIVLNTKKSTVVEHIHYDKNDRPRIYEVHCHPIFDKNGEIFQVIESCLDITDRKIAENEKINALALRDQSQEKMIEREKQFIDFFKNAPIGFHIFGPDKIIKEINETELDMIGYTRDEIIGKKSWSDLIVDDQRVNFDEHWQKLKETGKVTDLLYTLVHKNGQLIEVLLNASARLDKNGMIISTRGSVLDITERKKAEEEIAILSTAVKQSPTEIVITDTKGNIKYINPRFSEQTGYSPEEVFSKNPRILKSGIHDESFYLELWNTISFGKIWNGEFYNKKKNGDCFWENASISPIFDTAGKIINYVKVAEDITEQKKTEIKIAKLSEAVNQSPSVIVISDTKGNIEYVNPRFSEQTGYSAEEVIFRNPRILKSGIHNLQFYQELWKTISSGKKWHGELYNKKKSGDYYWENASISPIYNNVGKITNYVKVAEDITEQKKADETIRIGRKRLKILNKIIRHDLANDFVVIKSALNIYQLNSNHDMLKEIGKRVKQSLETIASYKKYEDFIDLNTDLIPLEISEIIKNVIIDIPEIKFNLQGSCPVYADDAISSVFTNLISNSVKHGKATQIDILISSKIDICTIKFIDNGIGIPYTIKDRIFDEGFFYGDTGHTGIGLHIVKETIERFEGSIFVDYNETKGASFLINLRKALKE